MAGYLCVCCESVGCVYFCFLSAEKNSVLIVLVLHNKLVAVKKTTTVYLLKKILKVCFFYGADNLGSRRPSKNLKAHCFLKSFIIQLYADLLT